LNVIRLKIPPRDETLTAVDAALGEALVNLAKQHGVYAVSTVMMGYLCQAIAQARRKHLANEDRWLADMQVRFERALRGEE
jgi:hypothetical protein